ncbi:TonB-dependent receptor [Hymenobacter setariae]|uniref:TonB-dependent receptor n=1 Tax=Hymenobacter setariae TaxID=2594794 RepID=A0A558BPG8_9BACT|nr:TonB-dependent receptor [Hymenobacter setariae]TVT38363.1 TonB-dependent receptor [Hymenobacter setariae]
MKKLVPPAGRLLVPVLACCLPLAVATAAPVAAPTTLLRKASQPTATITGRVTDTKGEGLPGVTVLVKGTTNGTTTGADGSFSLDAPDNATLVFSSIGYAGQEIPVNGRTTINLTLSDSNQALSDVVVVGYLTQKREDVTGSVASVSAVDANRAPAPTLAEGIQGRLPGVTIANSGVPGQAPVVNIRGLGTLASGSGPLYIVDGLWTDNLRDFNPQDAETIQVLKDAASLAPYGSRGANGVIIVTTKRGKAGKPQLQFNAYGGPQNIVKRLDLTNAAQWAAITNQAYDNAKIDRQPYANALPAGIDTDWQKELFQTGSIQSYDLGLSGGGLNDNGGRSNYNLSGSYYKQIGTIAGPQFERFTARINTGLTTGKLQIGESLLLSRVNQQLVNGLPFIDVVRMLPVTPVYDPANPGGYGLSTPNAVSYGTNPIGAQQLNVNTTTNNRLQGSIFGEYSFTPWLRYRLNLGLEYLAFHDRSQNRFGLLRYIGDPTVLSSYAENQGNNLFGQAENTLTFDKSFGKHSLTALVGYSRQYFSNEFTRGVNFGYGTGPVYYWALDAGTQNPQVIGSSYVNTKESYFAQLTYDYDQRYLITAAYRNDGSSRFDPNNRRGNFGAASLGWRISKERFFEGITAISDLKLRASYGRLGNDQLSGPYGGSYLYLGNINPNVNYPLGSSQAIVNGAIQTALPSVGIGWETRNTSNFGFDIAFLENRLTFGADYYISRTTDALVAPPIPLLFGNAGDNPYQRIGKIENRGFEFLLGYNENRNAFKYGISANLSTLRNRVLDVGNSGNQPNYFNAGPSGVTRTEAGYEVGSFFLYQFDGVYQTGESIPAGLQAGDARYRDTNGDGTINEKDRVHVGRVFPKFQYGLNLTASYGGFDAAVFLQGIQGNDVFNNTRYWTDRIDQTGNYRTDLNPWTPTNTNTSTPRLVAAGQSAVNNSQYNSTRWLEDGSYLRLKNVQIGYSLPQAVMDKLRVISRLRIYATGQNIFTATKYSGYDPETVGGTGGILVRGLDEGQYPNIRTFTLGIQAGF